MNGAQPGDIRTSAIPRLPPSDAGRIRRLCAFDFDARSYQAQETQDPVFDYLGEVVGKARSLPIISTKQRYDSSSATKRRRLAFHADPDMLKTT